MFQIDYSRSAEKGVSKEKQSEVVASKNTHVQHENIEQVQGFVPHKAVETDIQAEENEF